MPKKKGPPYTDDPGCKYIVIEDPWPGNASGKARTQVYYNHLCTWVRFMLGKAAEPEVVYSVNTRDEVIVQLPKQVDITPILGAHPWRRILSHGDARDKDRVSYVFEYDYRNRGEPGNHNWVENFPTVSGDPPPHLRFPVIFPYPHVSWASPKGKNCADLALPLPRTRQPTPVPDTSLFEPYQHPSQLTSGTVENAQHRVRSEAQPDRQPPGKLGKLDPYEEETNALRSLKADSVKREASDRRVKAEPDSGQPAVKQEPDPYGPSKQFRNAVERLQQARSHTYQASTEIADTKPISTKEEPPSGPSDAFLEAFTRVRGSHRDSVPEVTRVKREASHEAVDVPSESFRRAFERIRGGRPASTSVEALRVKPEPEMRLHSRTPEYAEHSRVKSEPKDSAMAHASLPYSNGRVDPRLASKRIKEEDQYDDMGRKRVKSETY